MVRKQAEAQDSIVGKPNADGKADSLPDSTETVDKNAVKPETVRQDYDQKPSDDKNKPVSKAAEDIETMRKKLAAYDLGVAIAKQLGAQTKVAASNDQTTLLKEAGRRDFDLLIAQAEAELKEVEKQASTQEIEKQAAYNAEAAGAQAFDAMYKEAALAAIAEENEALKSKLAEFNKTEQEKTEKEKTASLVDAVAAEVVKQLKGATVAA
jgi:uncharacterized membrane protein